ncbi:hypothetical protein [Salirhabdus salicampi]|uniref:hypothetical protein n=1 Tax=Salirhabdus salicampi TaxID=476102 RepID=UPI0020C223B4|nr:hypothetical protein [Salirhabdus salicampi]MCP8616950.1 hypothetical protein [Salirhabdus salicampi]
MKRTKFSQHLWCLRTFNEIAYDHETKRLYIFLFTGAMIEFQQVPEADVFQLVISNQKEEMIEQFKLSFPTIIHRGKRTISV